MNKYLIRIIFIHRALNFAGIIRSCNLVVWYASLLVVSITLPHYDEYILVQPPSYISRTLSLPGIIDLKDKTPPPDPPHQFVLLIRWHGIPLCSQFLFPSRLRVCPGKRRQSFRMRLVRVNRSLLFQIIFHAPKSRRPRRLIRWTPRNDVKSSQ